MALPLMSEINLENQDYEIADAAARTRLSDLENSREQAGGIPLLDANQHIKSENLALQSTDIPTTLSGVRTFSDKVVLKEIEVQEDSTFAKTATAKVLAATQEVDAPTIKATTLLKSEGDAEVEGKATINEAEIEELQINQTAEIEALTVNAIEMKDGTNVAKCHRYERKEITDLDTLWLDIAAANFDKYNYGNYVKLTGVQIDGTAHDLELLFADFDDFYGYAGEYAVTDVHHIACLVIGLPDHYMNATNTTEGGYKNSAMHSWLSGTVISQIKAKIGADHILKHKKILSKAVNLNGYNKLGQANGCVSGWGDWTLEEIALMSEMQIYGGTVFSSSGFDTGEACKQLEIFRYKRFNEIIGWTWLRDVAYSAFFCLAAGRGVAGCNNASAVGRAVPLILLK